MDPLSRNPLSSFSRRIPRLRQPSRLTTRVLHPSARIKADILARRPARQPPPCAPPHGTPRTPRCTPPCTPVTALCRLARAIHHSARCPAVPLARRASRPSCAAPRIPRMPHRTALRAIRRPTHHPAPPVTAPRAKADDPAPPLPAQRGTSAHREQMFHVKHSGRKSFPRDIRNREAPPVPRIRTNETLPNGARGAATVAAAPLARRSLMQFASARRRETAPPLIRLHDMRNADRSAPRPQPPARERRGSQADDEPRAEPSQSEPYQTEPSRTASGRIRPGRPNRSEPERFDRAEANRIRPNRTRASRTESDRSGPYRGKLDRLNRIGQTKANQAESSRDRSNRAGSNLSEPDRAGPDRTGHIRSGYACQTRWRSKRPAKRTAPPCVRGRWNTTGLRQSFSIKWSSTSSSARPCRPKRRESSSEVYALPPSSDARTPTTMQTAFLAFVHSLPAAAHGIAQASTANGRDWRRRRSCKPRNARRAPAAHPTGLGQARTGASSERRAQRACKHRKAEGKGKFPPLAMRRTARREESFRRRVGKRSRSDEPQTRRRSCCGSCCKFCCESTADPFADPTASPAANPFANPGASPAAGPSRTLPRFPPRTGRALAPTGSRTKCFT